MLLRPMLFSVYRPLKDLKENKVMPKNLFVIEKEGKILSFPYIV